MSLGPAEIMVILVVALLVFGPHRLPGIGRQVGRGMHELRKFQRTLRTDLDEVLAEDMSDHAEPAPRLPPKPALDAPAPPPDAPAPPPDAPAPPPDAPAPPSDAAPTATSDPAAPARSAGAGSPEAPTPPPGGGSEPPSGPPASTE